jgi:hypothetical protein
VEDYQVHQRLIIVGHQENATFFEVNMQQWKKDKRQLLGAGYTRITFCDPKI